MNSAKWEHLLSPMVIGPAIRPKRPCAGSTGGNIGLRWG